MRSTTAFAISDEELDSVSGGECLLYLNGSCVLENPVKLPFVMSLIS